MNSTTTVTFLNEPKLSEHEADTKFNDRRKVLVPLIKDLVMAEELFRDKHVNITFLHTGVSSLVSILDTGEEKYILKVPLSILDSRQEGRFLKAWEQAGVRVPHVIREGEIGNHYFTLMEYIDAVTLDKKYSQEELLENNIFKDLGSLLRKMHQPKTSGFSNLVNDKSEPEYTDIASWIEGDARTKGQIDFAKENNLLRSEEHDSVDEACNIILSRIGSNPESVFCHNDFNIANVFATTPFTVFDPWPCFHHSYMDLARAIVISLQTSSVEPGEQIIAGYFGDEVYDRKLLQAFIILNVAVKLKYQFETKNSAGIKNMQDYLAKTKHFLDSK